MPSKLLVFWFLKATSESGEAAKEMNARIEQATKIIVKSFWNDSVTELLSSYFQTWLCLKDTVYKLSPSCAPEPNSKAERGQQATVKTTWYIFRMAKHLSGNKKDWDVAGLVANY